MFSLMPRRRDRTAGTLTRGETPFDFLRREFASLFDRAFAGWPVPSEAPWEMPEPPGLEMEEREAEVVVRVELPGFELSEIAVMLRDNLLTVRAEHREPGAEGAAERRHARLERAVVLPPGIVAERVEALYRNGVLEVHIPRAAEALPRRIEVQT